MPPYGYSPLKTERFGGLNTLLDPTNLPSFASPDCQNIEFLPGLVRSRAGLTSLFTALGGNPTVNYLKTYITPQNLLRALVLDSFGNLYKENPFGTLALIGQVETAGVYGNSVSLFGREYIAFGDGQFGAAIPRQFDDTNFDRVSQAGPGLAPTVTDENVSTPIAASPTGATQSTPVAIVASPTGAVESANIVTITTSLAHGMVAGQHVVISGVGVAGYNGTFVIASVPTTTSFTYALGAGGLAASGGGTAATTLAQFTTTAAHGLSVGESVSVSGVAVSGYNGTWVIIAQGFSPTVFQADIGVSGLAASGSGTASAVGNIVAGVHEISVIFVTRQGYLTAPGAPGKWTAAGGKRAVVANIPIGPANVVQRILIFTASGGKSFFYSTGDPSIFSSSMIINDNSSTSTIVDFSDTILLEGINVDALFNLVELGECSGVTAYNSRLFWWGERNKINSNGGNGFTNLGFDGGWQNPIAAGSNTPLGWSNNSNATIRGVSAAGQGFPVVWGDAYVSPGNGTAISTYIQQPAFQDAFGNQMFQPGVSYSVRAKIARDVNLLQGMIHINLQSTIGGFTTAGLAVSASQLSTSYAEFIAVLLPSQTTIPSDLVLQMYADGTPTFNGKFIVDCIEVFPTNQPFNSTLIRCSKVEDPESFDGVTGILQPAPVNGQNVRCCYVLRNLLRIVKDSSLFVTVDDGTNEPDQWEVQEVSGKVGTLSARGVGLGDEWAVVAGRSGVWLDDGGPFTEDKKLSREIQPTWDSIDWSLGYLVDVKVDTQRKRIYIAVPLGSTATKNNTVLTMDYTEGFGDPTPTNLMSIAGLGRKWSIWTIGCNSMNLILRSDNTYQAWFGNNAGNGKVYQLDPTRTMFADDGVAFDAHWQSGFFQMPEIARMSWGYLIANVIGAGACNLILRKGDQGWITNVRPWVLSSLGFHNMERQINVETERLAVFFGTNGVADSFSLQGFSLWAKESTYAPLRGVNA